MKFWAGSEISGWGAKFCVEVANFVSVVKFWVGGGNILEIGQFKAKKNLPDRRRSSSRRRTGE